MKKLSSFVRTHSRSWLLIWLPFLLMWFWGVRYNPLTAGPGYGDALEVVWGFETYADFFRTGANPLYTPLIFHPGGWHTATLAHTPAMLLLMGAANLLLPSALVYNLTAFAASVVAYGGMRRLLRLYISPMWVIVVVALLYTFWGMRWLRLFGHLHMAWLSALLPWLVWFLLAEHNVRRRVWGAGLVWGAGILIALYGVWLGALAVGIYLLAQPSWRTLRESTLSGLIALAVGAPVIVTFWQANQRSDLLLHGIEHVHYWSASLNSLFVPSVLNPSWQWLTRLLYPGPYDESGIANFGLALALTALAGLVFVRRRKVAHRYAVLAVLCGLLFALGPIVRWSGQAVHIPALTLVDSYLWRVGQIVKPASFPEPWPALFAGAIPLPAYLFYAVVPFAEGARVASRFAFVAALGFFPLVALALSHIRARWFAGLVALLLLVETLPQPVTQGAPFPPAPHPAIAWLREQPDDGRGAVLDLSVAHDTWTLPISGELLYSTRLHHKPVVAGVGSFWPRSVWGWITWLQQTPAPLTSAHLPALLAEYDVRWILVHMPTGSEVEEIAQLQRPEFASVRCFAPPDAASAWPYPMCVVEIAPRAPAAFQTVGLWPRT